MSDKALSPGVTLEQDWRSILFSGLVLALALVPLLGWVYPFFIMQALCFALFASAFNVLIGHAGLASFGHAMFFGTGGYICAHALKVWAVSPHWALGLALIATLILGLCVGLIAIRRQGIYFSMTTLALAQMLYFVYLQSPFTHGEDGIQGFSRGHLFGLIDLNQTYVLYYVILLLFFLGHVLIARIIHSPFGDVLQAIRENETRAQSLGYETARYKALAFVLSAGLAGLAGAMKALVTQTASLSDVHWSMSGDVILMVVMGGMTTFLGPILGGFLFAAMLQYLSVLGQWVIVAQGTIFLACVVMFRQGLIGTLARRLRRTL
jgi:branched-chain amino acid transport system permease protein